MSDKFKSQAVDEFDKWSQKYDEPGFFQRHLFIPTEEHILNELSSRETPESTFRMLDVGCGTGKLVRKVGDKFPKASLAGVDIAPGMIAVASEKTKGQDRFQFQVANAAERLPFDDASLDYVTCCHSFHHYPNQPAAAKEFLRLLKPTGRLLFVDSYINSFWGNAMHNFVIGTYEKFQVHHFRQEALIEFLQGVGFAIERQDIRGGWVPWMMTICLAKQK